MRMRVCETIPSRRSRDLCPRGGSQTLHSRFDHAKGRLQLSTVRAGSATRKRESRQASDPHGRTGNALLPLAPAGGKRGVYLQQVTLFALSKRLFFCK